MKTTAHARMAALAAGLLLASAGTATAQESGTFTITQGGNQIATESFTRSDGVLETELEIIGQGLLATETTLGSGATVTRMELRVFPPDDPDADPLQSVAAAFTDSAITVEQPIGTEVGSEPAGAGTIPYINPSPSYMEQVVRRARVMGGDSVSVPVWAMGPQGGQTISATVTFGAEPTLSFGGVNIAIETDQEGRLLSARVPSQGLVIERE